MSDAASLPEFPVSPVLFDMAATEAGFVGLKASKLLSLGVVGEAVKKMGAVKIGRSSLLLSDEQVDRTFKLCEDLIRGPHSGETDGLEVTVDQRLAALSLMNHLASSRARMAEAMIRSATVDLSDSAKPAGGIPSFVPKAKSVPVVTAEVILEERVEKAKQKDTDGRSGLQVRTEG